jgi:fibronectin type 3 domain-containing protein
MPLFTTTYGLGIKLGDEPYSASLDRQRFTVIDNQFAFLSDLIGDGRIDGWHLSGPADSTVRVDAGMGIIDRFVTRTFGPLDTAIAADGTYYVFMKRKLGVVGGFSVFAPRVFVTYEDTTAPEPPASLTVADRTRDGVSLAWDANTERDLAGYNVYRSTDNTTSGWAAAATAVATVTSPAFEDSGLDEVTTYYYRVRAVDVTGNLSDYAAVSATTLADLRVPSDPRSVRLDAGNGFVQANWLYSADSFVSAYELTLQKLDATGADEGAATTVTASSTTRHRIFSGLDNGATYRVTVKAVTPNSVASSGVSLTAVPTFNAGPAEATSVTVTETWDGTGLTLHVAWVEDTSDPTKVPDAYEVSLIENGTLAGQTTLVPAGTNLAVSVFRATGDQHGIKEQTEYEVRVRGRTATGVKNVGVLGVITTSKFSLPETVSGLEVSLYKSRFARADWTNSTSDFRRNLFTLKTKNLVTNVEEVLVDGVDVGRAQSYVYDTDVLQNHSYTATVVVVDSAGNQSVAATSTLRIDFELPLPPAPDNISWQTSLGGIMLTWPAAPVDNVKSYKLWRADHDDEGVRSEDYELIDTLDADQREFVDYEVQAGQTYTYAVTTLDTFDNETSGPATGELIFNVVNVTAPSEADIRSPQNVTATLDGTTVVLGWDAAADSFDGWQIWRSVGNRHEYTLVGAVGPHVTLLEDDDIGLKGGVRYSYLVRKFRNEGDVVFNDSDALPAHCTPLGKVVVRRGAVAYDETAAVEIADIQDPVLAETRRRIEEHKHTYRSDADDRRISLDSTWTVDGWTTRNRVLYSTTQDISDTGDFTVYVNGVQTDSLYDLDKEAGEITFESRLPRNSKVSVVFDAIEETTGTLPEDKIESLSGYHFTKDHFAAEALPTISHDGRIGERLLPVRESLSSVDFLYYKTASAKNPVLTELGDLPTEACRTFYDVIAGDDEGGLLAAASDGVLLSSDFGHTWSVSLTTVYPVSRVYYGPVSGLYVALTGNAVYVASSLQTDWLTYTGLLGVGVVRDVTETPTGTLFVTADTGVFRLVPGRPQRRWEHCAVADYRTTNSFAVHYDGTLDAVVVATERGLFFSGDSGDTWSSWSAFDQQRTVYRFLEHAGALFALADDQLFRKKSGETEFAEVTQFTQKVRRVEAFRSRLYVASDDGVLTSTGDVLSDATIVFEKILPQLAEGDRSWVMTSLNLCTGRLFLGMEQRLYASDAHGATRLQYEQLGSVPTTHYVNDEERPLGVYRNETWTVFEERQASDATVELARQYRRFYAPNGGWADVAWKAPLRVYSNDTLLNDPEATDYGTGHSLSSIELPTLTSRNSVLATAQPLADEIEAAMLTIDDDFSESAVASLLQNVDKLKSELSSSLSVEVPPIEVGLISSAEDDVASVDVANGVFTFEDTTFGKYTQVTADVRGVSLTDEGELTHREVEDLFEQELSGVPAALARVQQCNLLKSGLFIEKTWGRTSTNSPAYQSEFYAGCGLDWYDRFNSTADYSLRVRKLNKDVTLQYPAAVLHVEDRGEVWVAGLGGVISINKSSLLASQVYTPRDSGFVRALFRDGDVVYVVGEEGIKRVAVADLAVTTDDGQGLPEGISTLAKAYNNLVAGTADGVYLKRSDGVWTKVLAGEEFRVGYLGDLMIAYNAANEVWSSPSGEGWTSKGSLGDVAVNAVAKHGVVFFGTDGGLYEDGLTFYSKEVGLKPVNLDDEATPTVNDLDSDGTILAAGLSDGRFFTYAVDSSGGAFTEHDVSDVLDAVHRIALIDGGVWAFGYDKVWIDSRSTAVRLATGNRLSWQI